MKTLLNFIKNNIQVTVFYIYFLFIFTTEFEKVSNTSIFILIFIGINVFLETTRNLESSLKTKDINKDIDKFCKEKD